jgi:hypothetical protein
MTHRWREMDPNNRYRIRNNPFWLPPCGPAIRLPQQKPALSCRGPMVRIHLPPAASRERTLRDVSLGLSVLTDAEGFLRSSAELVYDIGEMVPNKASVSPLTRLPAPS